MSLVPGEYIGTITNIRAYQVSALEAAGAFVHVILKSSGKRIKASNL